MPLLPLRVGLVASPGTEGCNDFLGGLANSGMAFCVTLAPTAVQGKDAPVRVAAAIADLQAEPLDVIVVVRGGGSKADLAAFDQEPVARAVATSGLPVWTGIGHTGDQSVADEVANRSYITPTECGQGLARLVTEYWRRVDDTGAALARLAREHVVGADRLLAARQRAVSIGARSQIGRHADRLGHRARTLRGAARGQLDTHGHRLTSRGDVMVGAARRTLAAEFDTHLARASRLALLPGRRMAGEHHRLDQWKRLLGAYDYRRQLERGYSVTRDASGRVLRSVSGVDAGALLRTRLADGELVSRVTEASAPPPSAGHPATPDNEGTK